MEFLSRFLMFTRPPGDDVYELLVTGDDQVGTLNQITTILAEGKVNFVSAHGQVDEGGKLFINAFFCEMAKAKVTPEALKKKLLSLPFVKDVKLEPMKGMMHEKFMFPMSTPFAGRVLIVGASAFTEIEGRLKEIFGSAGEVMAYEQGRAYALSTLKEMDGYRKKVGSEWDLGNIEAWVRAQGWADAKIVENSSAYAVQLRDLPSRPDDALAGGLGRFLTGMVVGMLESRSGTRLAAEPAAYDAATRTYSFKARKQPKTKQP